MLGFHNAKERDRSDWLRLFQEADPRFKFVDAKKLESSMMGIVEAVWMHP